MAPHSSTLAWKIPWTEEPGRLQPMGLQAVGHDRATSLRFSILCSTTSLSVHPSLDGFRLFPHPGYCQQW